MAERYVTRAEIAQRLNLTERQITTLVRDGRLSDGTQFPSRVSGRRRTFPESRCFEWYIAYKQEEALNRAAGREEPHSMAEAELRKAIADAEIAELKLATLRGDVAPIEQYRHELGRVLNRVRGRLNAIPGEYASQILEPLEIARAVALLRKLVASVLAELEEAAGGLADDEAEDAA